MDVGINRPIKHFIDQKYVEWAANVLATLPDGESVPAPSRELISKSLSDAWNDLPESTARNTFAKSFGNEITRKC